MQHFLKYNKTKETASPLSKIFLKEHTKSKKKSIAFHITKAKLWWKKEAYKCVYMTKWDWNWMVIFNWDKQELTFTIFV